MNTAKRFAAFTGSGKSETHPLSCIGLSNIINNVVDDRQVLCK